MTATQVNFKTETQEFISELVENNYSDEDIYEFIAEHGEDNFVSFYEEYVDFGEEYSYEAVDAFIEEFGISNLNSFADAFRGHYDSKGDYAEDFVTDCYSIDIPGFVDIDWEATFDNMDAVFTEEGFVFDTQF